MKNQTKNKILCYSEPYEIAKILTIASVAIHVLQPNSTQLDAGNSKVLNKYRCNQVTQPAGYWLRKFVSRACKYLHHVLLKWCKGIPLFRRDSKVTVKSLSRGRLFATQPVDCSPSGSSVHRILQARILEWVAISFSKNTGVGCQDLPPPRDRTQVSHIAGRLFNL